MCQGQETAGLIPVESLSSPWLKLAGRPPLLVHLWPSSVNHRRSLSLPLLFILARPSRSRRVECLSGCLIGRHENITAGHIPSPIYVVLSPNVPRQDQERGYPVQTPPTDGRPLSLSNAVQQLTKPTIPTYHSQLPNMAYRTGGRVDFEERDHYERQSSRAGVREYEDVDIRVRERERERDRVPAFLREDNRRINEAGALVLRARDVETVERPRRRSPSVTRVRTDTRIVERGRSPSPMPRREIEREDVRIRTVDRERVRSPSRVRTRIVERERERERSPSPERYRTRIVERGRSPSIERERIRIIERERERIPSPSPSPPPPIRRAPVEVLEREVITHYRDIDHGKPPHTFPPKL